MPAWLSAIIKGVLEAILQGVRRWAAKRRHEKQLIRLGREAAGHAGERAARRALERAKSARGSGGRGATLDRLRDGDF